MAAARNQQAIDTIMERSTSVPSKSELSTCFDCTLITVPVPDSSVPAVGYFALPGEIRNKIMQLVLCPGDIYLRSKPTVHNHQISYTNDPANTAQSPPGIQLLATCRQAYNEGHALYYSGNVFHLPPGPLSATETILNNMQPESLSLIRRVNLTAGLLDLASLCEDIETRTSQQNDCYIVDEGCGKQARGTIYSLIRTKVSFLATKLPGLRAVKHEVVLDRTETRYMSSREWQPLDEQWVGGPLQVAASYVGLFVQREIRDIGWESFKVWLSPRQIQRMEHEDLRNNLIGKFEFSTDTSVLETRWQWD